MPLYHVCSSLALPALPQFPNQEPPRPQQLAFPDLAIVPHLGHKELVMAVVVVVATSVYKCGHRSKHKMKVIKRSLLGLQIVFVLSLALDQQDQQSQTKTPKGSTDLNII